MSREIEFAAHVGENDVWVSARYTPGSPAVMPSLSHPGEPEDPPEVEVLEVWLESGSRPLIDIEGLFVYRPRVKGAGEYVPVEDGLTEAAIEAIRRGDW